MNFHPEHKNGAPQRGVFVRTVRKVSKLFPSISFVFPCRQIRRGLEKGKDACSSAKWPVRLSTAERDHGADSHDSGTGMPGTDSFEFLCISASKSLKAERNTGWRAASGSIRAVRPGPHAHPSGRNFVRISSSCMAAILASYCSSSSGASASQL